MLNKIGSLTLCALFFTPLVASAEKSPVDLRNAAGASAENGLFYPANRWSYQNMEKLYPTATVDRSSGPVFALNEKTVNLDELTFKRADDFTDVHLNDWLKEYSDAFIVAKNGEIIYEKYFNGATPRTRHQMMSVTKSISSIAVSGLVDKGLIDVKAPVVKYVPELRDTAWGDATVEQVMDMTVSMDYNEDYANSNWVNNYLKAMGLAGSEQKPEGMHRFLMNIKKGKNPHGYVVEYATPNTDVLCWIASRASGKSIDQLIEENIWSKLGMERDAFVLLDRQGEGFCGGGLNATPRDLVRVGMAMAHGGKLNGQEIASANYVKEVEAGGSKEAYARSHYGHTDFTKDWTYKKQWWVGNDGSYAAIGIYGQLIYINPVKDLVIVRQTSRQKAQDGDDKEMFHAIKAIGAYLK